MAKKAKKKTTKKTQKKSTAGKPATRKTKASSTKLGGESSRAQSTSKPQTTRARKRRRTVTTPLQVTSGEVLVGDTLRSLDKAELLKGTKKAGWQLALEGWWEEDTYHSGSIAYFVQRNRAGDWVLKSVERNSELDDVTAEDVRNGALNDDQLQLLWGMTLREAKAQRYEEVVAVWRGAGAEATEKHAAKLLYQAVCNAGGKVVTRLATEGLVEW